MSKVHGFSNNFNCSVVFLSQFLVFGLVPDVSERGDINKWDITAFSMHEKTAFQQYMKKGKKG